MLRLEGRWLPGLRRVVTVVTPFSECDFWTGKDRRMGTVRVQNFEPLQGATSQFMMIMVAGFKTGVMGERQAVTGVEAGRNNRNTIF